MLVSDMTPSGRNGIVFTLSVKHTSSSGHYPDITLKR